MCWICYTEDCKGVTALRGLYLREIFASTCTDDGQTQFHQLAKSRWWKFTNTQIQQSLRQPADYGQALVAQINDEKV